MFENQRYCTKGITENVPLLTQIIIWGLIDSMKISEKDYLQVFKLTAENKMQRIVHSQEQPPYEKTHEFRTDSPVTAKIYVIDDENHTTMLLAEEY